MCLQSISSGDRDGVGSVVRNVTDSLKTNLAHAKAFCQGDCGAELNQILAGGPKLIYYK